MYYSQVRKSTQEPQSESIFVCRVQSHGGFYADLSMLWPPAVAIRVPPKRDVPQQTPQRASPQARHGEPALLNTRACARLRSHQQHPPDDPAEAEAETEASTTPALPITARAQTRTNERTEGKNKGVPRRRNCAKRRTDTQPQTDLRTQTRAETKILITNREERRGAAF